MNHCEICLDNPWYQNPEANCALCKEFDKKHFTSPIFTARDIKYQSTEYNKSLIAFKLQTK